MLNQRFFFCICILSFLASASGTEAHARTAPRYRLVGYVAAAEVLPRVDAEKLTAINYAFAHIDAAGRIALDMPSAAHNLASLRALKSRNPQLAILASVGGWGAEGFSDAAADAAARARFAQSAVELIATTGIDGIDLDWEYPGLPGAGLVHRSEDERNFTLLLRELRQSLDTFARQHPRKPGDRILLTAALADREFVAHIELGRIHPYLDWINLMTYDFHNSLTPTTGHHAALARSSTSAAEERSVEHAVDQFLAAGVPAGKLVVGVPFYGRAFADVQPQNRGLDQPYGHYDREYTWPQLVAGLIDRDGYVRYWDDVAHVPYLWKAQTREFVSYDDPRSLALKADFVAAHALGGIMYWEQSQDPDGELLGVLAARLHETPH